MNEIGLPVDKIAASQATPSKPVNWNTGPE